MFQLEPLIAKILKDGLKTIRQDATILDDLFNYDNICDYFDGDDLEGLKKFIRKNEIPIRLAYPKGSTPLPCFSVTLGTMDEQDAVSGDTFYQQKQRIDGKDYDVQRKGAYYQTNYKIAAWAKDSTELVILLYHLAHYILFLNKAALHGEKAESVRFTGYDIEAAQQYYPEMVYTRPLILSARVPFEFEIKRELLFPIVEVGYDIQ